LYSDDFLEETHLKPLPQRIPFDRFFESSRQFEGINRDLFLDFKTYLVDDILVKVDRASMATSLEARVPLLDYKLVEFAFSLPPDYKLRGNTTKWFFKSAMKGILPERIIHRRKEGFSIPIKNWLKEDLKDLMMAYLSPGRLAETGLFNWAYVEKMINEHLSNHQNHSHRLWALILFELWREKYLRSES
jgi:asparagine synthase (glutamine-hydrolysing)